MGILNKIFGASDNAETLVKGAVSGLDAIIFTAEEKSEANAKLAEWYLKYLEATQPQNLARRWIALIIVCLWAFLILFGVLVAWFSSAMSEYVFKVLNELVHQPFMMIMGFYFLTHIVRTYQNGSKEK